MCINVFISDAVASASAVWELCLALWGDLDESMSGLLTDQHREESYVCQQARRQALSRWLTSRAAVVIKNEVLNATSKVG
jgi:hypothetical protein